MHKDITLWINSYFLQVDNAEDPDKIRSEAKKNHDIVCISALTGEGLDDFCNAVQEKLKVLTSISLHIGSWLVT